jgi:hypothetical protein
MKTLRIARHLRLLGCTEEQIRRHLNRGKGPPTPVDLRPKAWDWRSWESRIAARNLGIA